MVESSLSRRLQIKYFLLTMAFLLPLSWAFVKVRNLYPVASWNVMTRGGQIEQSHPYFVLRGETASGEVIDISAVSLTNAMRSRIWGMVLATANNQSLKLSSPHPKNAVLLSQVSIDSMPNGMLMRDLLRAWGQSHNARYPVSSPHHLKAIRIDAYKWPGREYSNFYEFVQSWREEL